MRPGGSFGIGSGKLFNMEPGWGPLRVGHWNHVVWFLGGDHLGWELEDSLG